MEEISSPDALGVVPLGDVLMSAADSAPEHPALITPEESWTYRELGERARWLARGLLAMGVQPGEHVGVLLPTGLDALAALVGVPLTGAVLVPINLRYQSNELRYVVQNADLVTVLTNDTADEYRDYAALLQAALPGVEAAEDSAALQIEGCPCLRSATVLGSKQPSGMRSESTFGHHAEGVSDTDLRHRSERVHLRDVGLMLHTSGTTADPRGCLITHDALVRDWLAVGARLHVSHEDRVWNPTPFFHITGIGVNLFTLAAAATVLSARYFEPGVALDLLEQERATVLYPAYPPITQPLLDHPRYPEADLCSARVMLNVAPPETMRRMQAAMPHAIQVSTYGGTEHCGCSTLHELSDDAERRVNTCGRPLPGTEIRIVDPNSGQDLAPGAVGEILMRGLSRFEGYYKDPDKTACTIDETGWMHTGDLGVLDARGDLTFRGRLTEMLKVGGENVAPEEIESYLGTHPEIHLVQVVGVPDAVLGEVPAAFVERKADGTMTGEQLIDSCKGAMARFKIPRYVRFVTEWPMSATKIQKSRLREQLIEELGCS